MSGSPKIQALLVADNVYVDRATRKHVIAGVFTRVWSLQFPTQNVVAWVYLNLRDVQESVQLRMGLRHDESQTEIWTVQIDGIRIADPNVALELALPLPELKFPIPGNYSLVLDAGGVELGDCRITAMQRPQTSPSPVESQGASE